jgi:hypothetical protein
MATEGDFSLCTEHCEKILAAAAAAAVALRDAVSFMAPAQQPLQGCARNC